MPTPTTAVKRDRRPLLEVSCGVADDRDGLRGRALRRPARRSRPRRPGRGAGSPGANAGGDRGPSHGGPGVGGAHHRDMMQVVCELGIEHADARMDLLAAVDQMSGPQTVLPQMVPVPARQHARAARPAGRPARGIRAVHGRVRRGCSRRGATRGSRRRGSRSTGRSPRRSVSLAIPADEVADRCSRAQLADGDTDGRARLAAPSRRTSGRPLARYSRRSAATTLPPAPPVDRWALVRPERGRPLPLGDIDRGTDAGAGPGPRSTRSAWTSSTEIDAERRAIASAGRVRRRHRRLPSPPPG